MPSCSKSCNPRGVQIEFFEDTHKYVSNINGKELVYTSGTQFLSKFYPQFDPDGKIAANCARREGITVEELKARWKAKGDESCRLGTRLHEICEDNILGRNERNQPENDIEARRFANGRKLAQKLRQSIDILGAEKIIFSDRLPIPIAGTIDLLGQSRKTSEVIILDWKTNKEITSENKYEKFCLEPIQHIPDISLHHYALQLSLYQYLLQFEGYVKKGTKFKRALLHVTEDGVEVIQCPDYTNEIKDMLIWSMCCFRS